MNELRWNQKHMPFKATSSARAADPQHLVTFLLRRIAEDEQEGATTPRQATEWRVKGAIVDWAAPDSDLGGRYVSDEAFDLLCLLATVYGDHPDCRPAWRRKVAFP